MKIFYSADTNGFYTDAIHGDSMPDDVVEESLWPTTYNDLMAAQSDGKMIIANGSGCPIAVDPQQPVRTLHKLAAEIASKRWQVETSGIIVGDAPIATDREAQSMLNSAYVSLKSGLIADTPWKSADGSFTLVTLAELEPVAQAVATHVRACFAAEQAHVEAINALETQAELDAYDLDTGWPSGR